MAGLNILMSVWPNSQFVRLMNSTFFHCLVHLFLRKGVEGVEYLIIFAVVIGMHRRKEVVFFLA